MQVTRHVANHTAIGPKPRAPLIRFSGTCHSPTKDVTSVDQHVVRRSAGAFVSTTLLREHQGPVNAHACIANGRVDEFSELFLGPGSTAPGKQLIGNLFGYH